MPGCDWKVKQGHRVSKFGGFKTGFFFFGGGLVCFRKHLNYNSKLIF